LSCSPLPSHQPTGCFLSRQPQINPCRSRFQFSWKDPLSPPSQFCTSLCNRRLLITPFVQRRKWRSCLLSLHIPFSSGGSAADPVGRKTHPASRHRDSGTHRKAPPLLSETARTKLPHLSSLTVVLRTIARWLCPWADTPSNNVLTNTCCLSVPKGQQHLSQEILLPLERVTPLRDRSYPPPILVHIFKFPRNSLSRFLPIAGREQSLGIPQFSLLSVP